MQKQIVSRISALTILYFALLCPIPIEIYFCSFIPKLANEQAMFQAILTQPYFLLDAIKFYVCGLMARSPEYLPFLYNPDVQASVFSKLLHCGTTFLWPPTPNAQIYFTPNEYTPAFDVLMIPGSLLPIRTFLIVWSALIPILSVALITFVLKRTSKLGSFSILGWWLITLASYYVYYNVFVGQTAMLISAMAALFFWALLNKRAWLIALTLNVMAIFKPHYAIVFLIAALCTRNFKAVFGTALGGLLILILTGLVVGPHNILDYPHQLALIQEGTASGKYYYQTPGMCNLLCPMILVFGQKLGFQLSYPIMLIGLVLNGIIWTKAYKSGESSYPFALATTLALTVITSAHANNYDLVIFFAAWAVTIPGLSLSEIRLLDNRYHRFWCYLFLLYPFIVDFMVLTNTTGGPYNLIISFLILAIAYLAFDSKTKEPLGGNQ